MEKVFIIKNGETMVYPPDRKMQAIIERAINNRDNPEEKWGIFMGEALPPGEVIDGEYIVRH